MVIMGAKKRRTKSVSGDVEDYDVANREGAQNNNGEDTVSSSSSATSSKEEVEDDGVLPQQTTLSGGPSLIFEMARRMLVWDDELYDSSQMLNDASAAAAVAGGTPSNFVTEEYLNSLPAPTTSTTSSSTLPTTLSSPSASTSTPRWRPSALQQSISNVNPNFRVSSPIMTNAGYASILRRNSRKKNKPSMWRHTLRIYEKMAELEKIQAEALNSNGYNATAENNTEMKNGSGGSGNSSDSSNNKDVEIPGVGTTISVPANASSGTTTRKRKRIRRSTSHHESALVAASKLGMWEEALLIFRGVEEIVVKQSDEQLTRGRSRVTDNMILSVVSACVKGSNVKHTATPSSPPAAVAGGSDVNIATNATNIGDSIENSIVPPTTSSRSVRRELTIEERRKPLDAARDILLSMEETHDIPFVNMHINPLASAYNRLGLRPEAKALINDHLKDRTPPPSSTRQGSYSKASTQWKEKQREHLTSERPGFEGVELNDWSDIDLDETVNDNADEGYIDMNEELQLNIHQLKAKDRASYALLVQGAAMEGDWTGAVQELQRMTEAGLHPNTRNLNSWSEVMERGCRPTGNGDQNNVTESSDEYFRGRQRRRSWKKKRDGIWLSNLR